MTHRLVTFLGTSDYLPIRYVLHAGGGEAFTSKAHRFVQAAIAEHLHLLGPVEVFVLATSAARERHAVALDDEVQQVCGVRCRYVVVPEGHSEEELWGVFSGVEQALQGASEVIVDITHGLRSLPATGLLAVSFYRHVLDVKVGRVLYGAFEAMTRMRGAQTSLPHGESIKQFFERLPAEAQAEYAAPIFDLTAMFSLPAWAEAASEWRRTGRAAGIIEQAKPFTAAIAQASRAARPTALTDLPAKLELLDHALTLVRHDKITGLAGDLATTLAEGHAEACKHAALLPFSKLLAYMRGSIEGLLPGDAPGGLDGAYLQGQIAAAAWHAGHGRVLEAFSLLRETLTSCAVTVAIEAGVTSLGVEEDGNSRQLNQHTEQFRTAVDGLVAVLSGALGRDATPRPQVVAVAPLLEAWLRRFPDVRHAHQAVFGVVQDTRNHLDHCWTGEASAAPFTRGAMKRVTQRLAKAIAGTRALVAAIDAARAGLQTLPFASPMPAARFMNLSNHGLESWSATQLEAARELGLGEPTELEGGMPLVPADADEAGVARLADDLVARALRQGARGAFVAGDYSLTFALVGCLTRQGVRCFAATTTRETVDRVQPDGASVKQAVFRFVRWREYTR